MKIFKKNIYIKNTLWLLSEKIGKAIFTFLISVIVARYLGPEQFGDLNYAQAYIALFLTIANFGMDSVVIRELVTSAEDKKPEIIGSSILIKLISSSMSFFLANLYAFLFINNSTIVYLIFILSFSYIIQILSIIDFYYQSVAIAKIPVISKLTGMIVASLINLLLIFVFKTNIIFFVITILFEVIITYTIMAFIFLKQNGTLYHSLSVSKNTTKNIIKDSWPLIISSLSVAIYMKIDQIMIGSMSGNYELGIYSVAVRLADLWYFIPGVLVGPFIPKIIKSKSENISYFNSNIKKMLELLILLGVIIAIGTTIFSEYIINILYGDNYKDSVNILVLYIWIGVFVNIGTVKSLFLNVHNLPKIQLYASFIACIMNITLNYILIPEYGGIGATFASLISYWFQSHLSLYLFAETRSFAQVITKALLQTPLTIIRIIKRRSLK